MTWFSAAVCIQAGAGCFPGLAIAVVQQILSWCFAGSVDEQENEQGMAHLVEHVTFLGSAKRERLLGTGARSNAYTDFHHTVFHVHSPLVNENNPVTRTPMLPQVP